MILFFMASDTQGKQIVLLQVTLMQIGLAMLMTKKSTSEGCFYVGNNLVAWMSRKQSLISLSTI
jgi:hypothetical protein